MGWAQPIFFCFTHLQALDRDGRLERKRPIRHTSRDLHGQAQTGFRQGSTDKTCLTRVATSNLALRASFRQRLDPIGRPRYLRSLSDRRFAHHAGGQEAIVHPMSLRDVRDRKPPARFKGAALPRLSPCHRITLSPAPRHQGGQPGCTIHLSQRQIESGNRNVTGLIKLMSRYPGRYRARAPNA